MKRPYFITGIGTDVGKTLVSAVLAEALEADYWKPVQAGLSDGTDAATIASLISNSQTRVREELYRLQTPASPHIAARIDHVDIDPGKIKAAADQLLQDAGERPLLIEGAGGLLVPFSDTLFVADLIRLLNARVLLVSRNYLGSINHSLLTAAYCKNNGLDVAGWLFTDDYMNYENEIVRWSGYPSLGSIPRLAQVTKETIREQALALKNRLVRTLAQ